MTTYYLLRQPDKLESLAIDKLAVWIGIQGKKLMSFTSELQQHDAAEAEAALSRHIEAVRTCLQCNMPRMLHDTLLSKTIKELNHLSAQTKLNIGRMVESLFSDSLTSLSLNLDQFAMIRDLICAKSQMLVSLMRLDLIFETKNFGYRCSGEMEYDIIQLLKELHNLRYLSITNAFTDNILTCILNNCPLIEELNLNTLQISNYTIDRLRQLENLKSFTSKTLVRGAKVDNVLLYCKNIENIHTNDSSYEIWRCLQRVATSKHNDGLLFSLKTYESQNNTLGDLQMTFRMCPFIQNLTIYDHRIYNNSNSNIMAIIALQDLRELKLVDYKFYSDQVNKALKVIGYNIEHLHLLRVSQIDTKALMDISQMCSNLESISLEECTYFIDRTPTCTEKLQIPPFENLKKLTLDMKSNFYNQLSPIDLTLNTSQELNHDDEPAYFVISNCFNIEYIEFTRATMLTEDFMLTILDKNPLTYLKELKIVQSYKMSRSMTMLTTLVLDRIFQNCINRPEIIQILSETERVLTERPIDAHWLEDLWNE